MKQLLLFCVFAVSLMSATPDRVHAHDLPGQVAITGFFVTTEAQPQLILRVPLVMLTNQNLAKRGPGYLDLANLEEGVARARRAVAQAFQIEAAGVPLQPSQVASRISLPSERTFETAEAAVKSILGPPLSVEQNVFWNQGFFDVQLVLDEAEPGADYTLAMDLPPGLAERTMVTLTILSPDKLTRILTVDGTTQAIALDPRWYQAGFLFLTKGVEHILIGTDHLLFLLCLVLPLHRDPRRLFGVVTAFTLGHSATLIPAALGLAPSAGWFLPVVETLIAASIVYMAVENLLGADARLRWKLAFGFGLIHGFGFASTLTDVMHYAGSHLLLSLVFFNVGIELGQVLVLAAVLSALALVFRTSGLKRSGIIVISVLAGHEAWHWATERAREIPTDLVAGMQIYEVLTWAAVLISLAFGFWWATVHLRQKGQP